MTVRACVLRACVRRRACVLHARFLTLTYSPLSLSPPAPVSLRWEGRAEESTPWTSPTLTRSARIAVAWGEDPAERRGLKRARIKASEASLWAVESCYTT